MVVPLVTPWSVNAPSKSVTVAFFVPFTDTDAPIIGSPVASFTTPLHAAPNCATIVAPNVLELGTVLALAAPTKIVDSNRVMPN